MRVLLVEDESSVVEALKAIFTEQNFVVDIANDGETGWELVDGCLYDLVILDVMLPKLDGISFCRRLRAKKNAVLVLMLTARDTATDKMVGLDAGADDYVVKPFNIQELAARIRALLRRARSHEILDVLECGGFRLDANTRETSYRGQPLQFSRKELLILELLMRNPHQVFSRALIVDRLWAYNEEPPSEDTIKSHVKTIRRKLGIAGASDLIETLYGQGYRINPAFINQSYTAIESSLEVMESAVASIWERTKGASLERITLLETIVQLLDTGMLNEEWHLKAIQSAHKLAGSLGTFGFEEGSTQARQIEHWLQASLDPKGAIAPAEQQRLAQKLQPSVFRLQQIVGIPVVPLAPSPKISELATGSDLATGAAPVSLNLQPTLPPSQLQLFPGQHSPSSAVQCQPTIPAKVLAVDDDEQILMLLTELLQPYGVEVVGVSQPRLFWDSLNAVQPDLLILDVSMPSTNGLELCKAVRDNFQWSWLPIVLLTAQGDRGLMHEAFAQGVDDFVEKPIVPSELVTRLLNRLERSQTLRSYAEIDGLTGIANRTSAIQSLDQWLQLGLRSQQPICLAWLELDSLNGEASLLLSSSEEELSNSDRRLRQFGQFLKHTFGAEEIVARWSDTEFIVVLYGELRANGVDRIAQTLEAWRSLAPTQNESFSGGVAQFPLDGTHVQMLYRTAESALHWAKQTGCGRILPSDWQPLRESSQLAIEILFVCKDTPFRQIVAQSLYTRGYHIHCLSTGQEAIDGLKGKVPAFKTSVVVIADDLPDYSTVDLLQQLGRRFVMQVRVVAWLHDPELAPTMQALGAFDYGLLPCDRSVIVQQLRRSLQF
jgi:two-component system, OmpR family, response regulator